MVCCPEFVLKGFEENASLFGFQKVWWKGDGRARSTTKEMILIACLPEAFDLVLAGLSTTDGRVMNH